MTGRWRPIPTGTRGEIMRNRQLTVSETRAIRTAQRDGYNAYRYGSERPVTVARILTGEARKSRAAKVLDVMRDWRLSPFELEGQTRAGLRSGFCISGYGWHRSDQEAAALVEEALRDMNARRPTWIQGQREYTIPRENCQNCGGPLDEEAIANHEPYCCTECRTVARVYRNESYWYAMSRKSKLAYHVARKERLPKRPCGWCGTEFQPTFPEAATCSPSCAAKLREHKAGRAIADRVCANPTCGKVFHPAKATVKYCSTSCHREHLVTSLPERGCEHCGSRFQPVHSSAKYCSRSCGLESFKAKRPKDVDQDNWSNASASSAPVAKVSAFRCEEVFQEAAE